MIFLIFGITKLNIEELACSGKIYIPGYMRTKYKSLTLIVYQDNHQSIPPNFMALLCSVVDKEGSKKGSNGNPRETLVSDHVKHNNITF